MILINRNGQAKTGAEHSRAGSILRDVALMRASAKLFSWDVRDHGVPLWERAGLCVLMFPWRRIGRRPQALLGCILPALLLLDELRRDGVMLFAHGRCQLPAQRGIEHLCRIAMQIQVHQFLCLA